MKKIYEVYQEFSTAMDEDQKTNTPTEFYAVAKKVVQECIQKVQTKYSISLALRIRICNTQEFDAVLSNHPYTGAKPTAFIYGRFIAVNIATLLDKNLESFIANFVLNVMEELVHATFPFEGEVSVKQKTHELTEAYLEYSIRTKYKKNSLKRAGKPGY